MISATSDRSSSMTVTPMSMRSCALRGLRTGAITSSPRVRRTRTTALPTKPDAPEIQMRRLPEGFGAEGSAVAGVAGAGFARRGVGLADVDLTGVGLARVGLAGVALAGVAACGFEVLDLGGLG